MFVCLCNCINKKQLDSAVSKGVEKPAEIFRMMGCKPQCGKCVPEIADAIMEQRDGSSSL